MNWQTFVTFLIIALAAWRVWLEIYRTFVPQENSNCGGCHGCPSTTRNEESKQLVSLELGTLTESHSDQ